MINPKTIVKELKEMEDEKRKKQNRVRQLNRQIKSKRNLLYKVVLGELK